MINDNNEYNIIIIINNINDINVYVWKWIILMKIMKMIILILLIMMILMNNN